jgi:hypothetical protein
MKPENGFGWFPLKSLPIFARHWPHLPTGYVLQCALASLEDEDEVFSV